MLADVHLLRPLWLLALLPLWALLWWLLRPQQQATPWRHLVDAHLLPPLLAAGAAARSPWHGRRLALALLAIGGSLVILALAGPSWRQLPTPVFETPAYRVIVLDLSRSMLQTDLAPTRLARARFEALDLLRQSPDAAVGLLAYGAQPYVVAPVSQDAATLAHLVPVLRHDLLPVEGKRLAPALQRAAQLLRDAGATRGDVVVLTDGISDPAAALQSAQALAAQGYRLSILSLGDSGNREVLDSVARTGGGRHIPARLDDEDIAALPLYAPTLRDATRAGREGATEAARWHEEGPWLLLLALPLAALAFRRGWLGVVLVGGVLGLPGKGHALDWSALWWTADQRGAQALAADDPGRAAELFTDPAWQAAARYRQGDYAAAASTLAGQNDPDSQFNRGNMLARLGQLEAALAAYDAALQQDPGHADARHNRALVARAIAAAERQATDDNASGTSQGAGEDSAQPQQPDGTRDSDGQARSQQAGAQDNASGDNAQAAPQPGDETANAADTAAPAADSPAGQPAATANESRPPQAPPAAAAEAALAEALQQLEATPEGTPASAAPEDALQRPPVDEQALALRNRLQQIADDPGGLLRQRFMLQHLRQQQQTAEDPP